MRHSITTLIVCLLYSQLSLGTTYYVRTSGAEYSAEDGTSYANAFDGFSDISGLAAGDILYACGAFSSEKLTIPTSGNSTSQILYSGACPAGGSGPSVADPATLTYTGEAAITGTGKQFITIQDFTIVGGGVYLESNASFACHNCIIDGITASGTTGTTACLAVRAKPSGTAMLIPPEAASGIQVTNSTVSNCGAAGLFINEWNSGALVYNLSVDGAGSTGDNWGIYLASVGSSFGNANCTFAATGTGTSYSCTMTGTTSTYTVETLLSDTRVSGNGWLTKNAGAQENVALGEWDQDGATIYVNVGVEPTTGLLTWKVNRDMQVIASEVQNMSDTYDGTGIGADNGVEDAYFIGNYSHDNPGNGIEGNGDNITIVGNVVENNETMGISFTNTRSVGYAYNNTCLTNTRACLNKFRAHTNAIIYAKNNAGVGVNGAQDRFAEQGDGTTYGSMVLDYNSRYNFGQTNTAGLTNGANDVTADPLLSSGVPQTGSPLINAGTYVYPCHVYGGGSCLGTYDIGAYQGQFVPYGYTIKPNTRLRVRQ